MGISYDVFTGAFLSKISEYDFGFMPDCSRSHIVDGYMKRAFGLFRHVCLYDFISNADDRNREFALDIPGNQLDEIVDIISEGMVAQWLKPALHNQENLENVMNTRDFTTYSAGNLLLRIREVHSEVSRRFTNMIRAYSYHYGDLKDLHI